MVLFRTGRAGGSVPTVAPSPAFPTGRGPPEKRAGGRSRSAFGHITIPDPVGLSARPLAGMRFPVQAKCPCRPSFFHSVRRTGGALRPRAGRWKCPASSVKSTWVYSIHHDLQLLILAAVTEELGRAISGGKVERVAQPTPFELVVRVYHAGATHRVLLSCDPEAARVHLTQIRRETPRSRRRSVWCCVSIWMGPGSRGQSAAGLRRARAESHLPRRQRGPLYADRRDHGQAQQPDPGQRRRDHSGRGQAYHARD